MVPMESVHQAGGLGQLAETPSPIPFLKWVIEGNPIRSPTRSPFDQRRRTARLSSGIDAGRFNWFRRR